MEQLNGLLECLVFMNLGWGRKGDFIPERKKELIHSSACSQSLMFWWYMSHRNKVLIPV